MRKRQVNSAHLLFASALVSLTGLSACSGGGGSTASNPGAWLGAAVDSGSGSATLLNGEQVDFASQSVGGGPSAEITITLSNSGNQSISLSAPVLESGDHSEFTVVVDTGSLPSHLGGPRIQMPSPLTPTAEDVSGLELRLESALLADLTRASAVSIPDFALPDGELVGLELERLPSPWQPGAVVAIDGVPHPGGAADLTEGLSLWTGRIAGDEQSRVFLSFSPGGTRGWVRPGTPGQETFHVSAVTDEGVFDPARSKLVTDSQLLVGGDRLGDFCSGQRTVPGNPAPETSALPETQKLVASNCRVAFETDYQFFQLFGDESAATTYVTQLVSAVADQYLEDVQTTLTIAYLGLYTDPSDPWATPDSSGTADQLLTEFENAWAPIKGGSWPIPTTDADLAHFLSGGNIGGGIAYVDVLCNTNFGFGVSGSLSGSINWDTFDGEPDVFNWDFIVLSHELGHNFGAIHTHEYCPPLDICQTSSEPGGCNPTSGCERGTLMSYCHLCAGGSNNIDLEFHPDVANIMRQSVNDSCLAQSGLPQSASVDLRIRFDPDTVGPKSTLLHVVHDAENTPSPFEVELTGSAVP